MSQSSPVNGRNMAALVPQCNSVGDGLDLHLLGPLCGLHGPHRCHHLPLHAAELKPHLTFNLPKQEPLHYVKKHVLR
ncbi:hypothetical protein E2C01_098958 [Portunus trituberculatus]|uniref:Uncharacterized protein n=1 Tax=Portunus trituberculatus TaxID=210409 RepID=A0A5B7K914_PORTR|nr:hypothetical protein [Portunus trituberculatus]